MLNVFCAQVYRTCHAYAKMINGITAVEGIQREHRGRLWTPEYYLSKCRTFLPILLAAAATIDSVIPVKNHVKTVEWDYWA